MKNDFLLHTPEGVRDIYGDDYLKKIELEKTIREVFIADSYKEIQTPTIEYFDVFSSDIGMTASKDLYKFYDSDGNTLVLRPDFTPSIARCAAKYFMEDTDPIRFCYQGNTFSNTSSLQGKLKEVTQMGAELICAKDVDADAEMISLALKVLKKSGLKNIKITVGNADFYKAICEELNISKDIEIKLKDYIAEKNDYACSNYLKANNISEDKAQKLIALTELYGKADILDEAINLSTNERAKEAILRLKSLNDKLVELNIDSYVSFDLGMLSKYNYYTGVVFRAYTYGIGEAILKGGRYDNLLKNFGKDAPAIGFCVVIDDLLQALENQNSKNNSSDDHYLTFALGKGRLANKTMDLLEKLGITCEEMKDKDTRKLIFVNEEYKLKFFLAKGPDVPTYVEYGAADIGVVGKDTIIEENRDVFEVLDLGFGKCRMCVCGPESARELLAHRQRIRVASKYPLIAKDYFYNTKHQTVDIIKLNGSVELGPIVELSDVIVDIVETGSTLKENGLTVLEEIIPLSARMIVNPVSMHMEQERIKDLINKLKKLCEE